MALGEFLDRTSIGLDFFDASINRTAGPSASPRPREAAEDFTARLVLFEESKSLPFDAAWHEHCRRTNVPVGTAWLGEVQSDEKAVLSK